MRFYRHNALFPVYIPLQIQVQVCPQNSPASAHYFVLNLDLNFEIQHTDFTAAKGIIDQVDVVVGQEMHTQPFSQQVPIVITAENFIDSDPLKQQLVAGLKKQGWL